MTHLIHASSPWARRSGWPVALLVAALAASFSGCMRADAGTNARPAEFRTLVVLEKRTANGETFAVPIAEEYSAIRPAGVDGAAPAIPPSEIWPAQ